MNFQAFFRVAELPYRRNSQKEEVYRMATLLRWYNPMAVRLALVVLSLAISFATGSGVVFADDDGGGGP